MRGLDSRIHLLRRMMDCRVKPGNDAQSAAGSCCDVTSERRINHSAGLASGVAVEASGRLALPSTHFTDQIDPS